MWYIVRVFIYYREAKLFWKGVRAMRDEIKLRDIFATVYLRDALSSAGCFEEKHLHTRTTCRSCYAIITRKANRFVCRRWNFNHEEHRARASLASGPQTRGLKAAPPIYLALVLRSFSLLPFACSFFFFYVQPLSRHSRLFPWLSG